MAQAIFEALEGISRGAGRVEASRRGKSIKKKKKRGYSTLGASLPPLWMGRGLRRRRCRLKPSLALREGSWNSHCSVSVLESNRTIRRSACAGLFRPMNPGGAKSWQGTKSKQAARVLLDIVPKGRRDGGSVIATSAFANSPQRAFVALIFSLWESLLPLKVPLLDSWIMQLV